MEILLLAAPIAGLQLAQIALTSIDLMMMGLLSVKAVAAGGLAILLFNQLRTMCIGMVTGVGNLVASAVGHGERRTGTSELDSQARHEIADLLRAAMLIATLGAVIGGVLLFTIAFFLPWFGQDPAIVDLARPVMFALAPGLFPMLWLNVLRQFAVGLRRAGSLLSVAMISIGINALLNAMFIYGWAGMPRLGLTGIGLSTTLVQFWTFLTYLRTVRRDPQMSVLLVLDGWRAQSATVGRIARMGAPIALTYGSEAALTSVASLLMGTFGPVALAASNVVNQLAYIAYQFNIGLSHGASILVSRMLAHRRYDEISGVARRTLTISFSTMSLIGLLYVTMPKIVLSPFLGAQHDPAVFAEATVLLWFAIAHQFFKGTQNIFIGLLRGLGNTKGGLKNTFIGYWVVGIPAMILCSYGFGLRGNGIWFGLCLSFAATSVLLLRRFKVDLLAVNPGV
ncbi:putative efflux protein, MATE family [Herbaspirillum sp. CF444]|nr:putative efflux protein, MATE family [Herbaspirillum sp. CF444]